jgi:glycosyltransferase involved in cell wall biosynthesis
MTLPYPGTSGQQQRVYYTLKSLRAAFHVTFLTATPQAEIAATRRRLLDHCDETILLPSLYTQNRLYHKIAGWLYALRTGLKASNYVVGQLELAPQRIAPYLASGYDLALFEYSHAAEAVPILQASGVPCALDMHNILWQSYRRQLDARPLPGFWKRCAVHLYRRAEECAWRRFDALIAINQAEREQVQASLGADKRVFYAPMGIDLDRWSFGWQPVSPPRIAYYGGLGSAHNQRDALRCVERIMPRVWARHPDAELWLVGSHPPPGLMRLSRQDARIKVTGYVETAQEILRAMSLVLCPWSGAYGFRSRLVEVMALGVPVVAAPDAVYGMALIDGDHLLLRETDDDMARACQHLIETPSLAVELSRSARRLIETRYNSRVSYDQLTQDLLAWLAERAR